MNPRSGIDATTRESSGAPTRPDNSAIGTGRPKIFWTAASISAAVWSGCVTGASDGPNRGSTGPETGSASSLIEHAQRGWAVGWICPDGNAASIGMIPAPAFPMQTGQGRPSRAHDLPRPLPAATSKLAEWTASDVSVRAIRPDRSSRAFRKTSSTTDRTSLGVAVRPVSVLVSLSRLNAAWSRSRVVVWTWSAIRAACSVAATRWSGT